jgi:hypothetical protein
MTRLDVDVVLGGGIFSSGDQGFLQRIEDGLNEVAAHARVRVLDVPPVVGAALLGLDKIGARDEAHRRARTALAETGLGARIRRKEG